MMLFTSICLMMSDLFSSLFPNMDKTAFHESCKGGRFSNKPVLRLQDFTPRRLLAQCGKTSENVYFLCRSVSNWSCIKTGAFGSVFKSRALAVAFRGSSLRIAGHQCALTPGPSPRTPRLLATGRLRTPQASQVDPR